MLSLHITSIGSVTKTVAKSETVYDIVQWAVCFIQKVRGASTMLRNARKRLLRKQFMKDLLRFFQMTKSTQRSASIFTKRSEQVRQTKFETELIEISSLF